MEIWNSFFLILSSILKSKLKQILKFLSDVFWIATVVVEILKYEKTGKIFQEMFWSEQLRFHFADYL